MMTKSPVIVHPTGECLTWCWFSTAETDLGRFCCSASNVDFTFVMDKTFIFRPGLQRKKPALGHVPLREIDCEH